MNNVHITDLEEKQWLVLKYIVLLVYIALNKPHSPITGLTYISNTQPQNIGLAYMRYDNAFESEQVGVNPYKNRGVDTGCKKGVC